jgi:uncharacterized oligopeptide transporter (OPT) family protein
VGSLARLTRREGDRDSNSGPGLLFAAGLVAGEALMGVLSGALVTAGLKLPLM